MKQFLTKKSITVLYHLPYSSDLASADYFLFPKMKSNLKGRHFDTISDIQNNVTSELKNIAAAEFCTGVEKRYNRASRCIELGGMCVEGYHVKSCFLEILIVYESSYKTL
jgi:hypothetical protein